MAFIIKALEEKTVEESAASNPVRALLKSASWGGELCKLGLWRGAAARAHCVQQETKPNKFHLVLQNFWGRGRCWCCCRPAPIIDLEPEGRPAASWSCCSKVIDNAEKKRQREGKTILQT